MPTDRHPEARATSPGGSRPPEQPPDLALIYDAIPIGLAFLSPDCRYLQINQRMTEICGIPVADHLGRSVRETLPRLAEQVEKIVRSIIETGEPVTGIEVSGERPDESGATRYWTTNWQPLKDPEGKVLGVNVAAEEITHRKRTELALQASEARFRELADNISQFAWTADATGWIYWYNKRWHDYTGTTLEEMAGWGWRKVHHPDHVQRVVDRITESFTTGSPWEDTFPLRSREGEYRWFLSRALPIRNELGEVIRWFGTNTDVTEQIEAETALRELNETLEQRVEAQARERTRIWNVSQDLLVVADREGKFLSVNPAWTATLGWSKAELIGRTADWLVHPHDADRTRAETARLAGGDRTLRFENRLRHKNGSYCRLSWTAVPDQDLIYGVARDITELERAERELRESQQELARVSRRTMMGAMTASIAHELNQPLAAIMINANAGLRWLTRPEPQLLEVRAALERIVNDGRGASEVIESVRAMFTKEAAGKKVELNLNDIVKDVLSLVRGELESQQVSLRLELFDELPPVFGDRVQLQQVLLNLIMNAVEAMKSVTDRPRLLQVTSEVGAEGEVMVTVHDSGEGIDPEDVKRIFNPFFTTKWSGMGLGLAISRSIVEAHSGSLWASSRAAGGSVFHVVLPKGGEA